VRALIVVLLVVGAVIGWPISGPCERGHVDAGAGGSTLRAVQYCQYMPNPYNNGPLMPTWELPGGSPVICDPTAYRCYPATPGSGF
jgi:hypothetical protein